MIPFNVLLTYFLYGLLSFILFLAYKLTYWSRHGFKNDYMSVFIRYSKGFHITDTNAIEKYGKVVGGYEFFQPVLMISDIKIIREILIKNFITFANHRFTGGINTIGGNGIFVAKYEEWKRYRTITSPTFSTIKLKQMKERMLETTEMFIRNLTDVAEQNQNVDIKQYLVSFTLDTFALCAFSIKIDSLRNPKNPMVHNSHKLFSKDITLLEFIAFNAPSMSAFGNFFKVSIFDMGALRFIAKLVTDLINERKNKVDKPVDFIQILLDAELDENENDGQNLHRKLSTAEIIDQSIIFLIAGHDTTATSLSSAFYYLAKNPPIQQRLLDEVRSLSEEESNDWAVISELEYLNAFYMEVLRYMPPVPRIERRARSNFMLGNYKVRKGLLITFPVYAIHHDPENFPDPEVFDPERFIGERKKEQNLDAWVPFADGPRSCIGKRFAIMQMKICLCKVLRKLHFEFCPETKDPLKYYAGRLVSTAHSIVLKPILD